jgi:NAD/NADP transhydrogenase beta subunit
MPAGFESFGKTLMLIGVIMIVVGALIYFGGKITGFGKLPGDIHIQRENFSFYFPVATSILLSIILTIILNIFTRR